MTVADAPSAIHVARALEVLRDRKIAVLSGAGISTDSGIPAYRGADAKPRTPMTVQQFLADDSARRRYWTGSHLGWRAFSGVEANEGHRALARMEDDGVVSGVITQNVDGLHLRGGSTRVIEMHGTMHRVVCLRCGQVFARTAIAAQIERHNPWIATDVGVELGPDGDVTPEQVDRLILPTCTVCAGALKPDVVFFGEFVPRDRFRDAESLVHASDALIVAGSSLVVNSGVRVIERARRRGIPIVIINRESTRADAWAEVVLNAGTSETLRLLSAGLRH